MISWSDRVEYRESRLCSGAIFPVRFEKRHGGSAKNVPKLGYLFASKSSEAVGSVPFLLKTINLQHISFA